MSIFHILIYVTVSALIWATPLAILLRRFGYSPFWAICALIPFLGVALLWILAFMPLRGRDAN